MIRSLPAAIAVLLITTRIAAAADGGAAVDAAVPDAAAGAAVPDAAVDAAVPDAAAVAGAEPVDTRPPATRAVTGTLFARGSRTPLAGVSLVVDGAAAAETDEAGRFTLVLPVGLHTVQIAHPAHDLLSIRLLVEPDPRPIPPLVVRLEPSGVPGRFETIVRGRAPDEAPKITITGDALTKTPGAFGDPFRVIESLPGVAQVVWPLAIYAIRGSNPGNTGFLIDGLRVPALFHFALGPAVLHPYFIDRIDFYPGAYPARYGRYTAGLVAASTQSPPADRAHGSIDLRLVDAGGMVSTPFDGGRGTVAAAARYGYPSILINALQDDATLDYWDYQVRATHTLGPGELTLTTFGAHDALEPNADDDPSQEDRLELTFHRAHLRWRGVAGAARIEASLAAGADVMQAPFDDDALRVRSKLVTPRLMLSRPLGTNVDLEVGADGEIQRHDTDLSERRPDVAAFAMSRTTTLAGAWAGVVYRSPTLVVAPSLRFDAYRESGAAAGDLGPRLNVRLRAGESTWLKASGGRTSQMPSMPLQLPGFEGFGLAQHGLQTSWQGAGGVETDLGATWSLDATAFIQRSRLTDVRDPQLNDALDDDFLVPRQARAYGVELLVKRPPSAPLYGWLSYTLSRAERAFESGVILDSDWDQRHILNLVAGYRLRRYTFGGRFHLATGRPVKVRHTTITELRRLPTFYQLDLRVDHHVVLDRWVIDLYFEVANATRTRNVVGYERGPTGVLEENAFVIALPTIGMRAEF